MDADRRIAELEAELAATQRLLAATLAALTAKEAKVSAQDERIGRLEEQVTELAEKLGQNSDNSHLPPSSDSPEQRRKRRDQRYFDTECTTTDLDVQRPHRGQLEHPGLPLLLRVTARPPSLSARRA